MIEFQMDVRSEGATSEHMIPPSDRLSNRLLTQTIARITEQGNQAIAEGNRYG